MITKQNCSLKTNYTRVENSVLNGKSLTLSGIGLYCLICSLPENWDLNARGLATRFGFSEKEIRNRLKELVDKGYLVREQDRTVGRFSGFDYRICSSPHTVIPDAGTPRSGLPDAGLGRQYNKRINNKTYKKENKESRVPRGVYDSVEF